MTIPHTTTADVASAIADAVEAQIGVPLPVPPRVLCAAYGWRPVPIGAGHHTEYGAAAIAWDADASPNEQADKLARACAVRVATASGFSNPPPALVRALALRLCACGGGALDTAAALLLRGLRVTRVTVTEPSLDHCLEIAGGAR